MNIYEVDIFKESGRGDINHYIGRWFVQLPINKKHKLYLLTEFQPVYDFENDDHFSFWFGPEFGKAFAPSKGMFRNGGAVYVKPGLGVGPDEEFGDRDWTVEVGFRVFFPPGKDTYGMMQQQRGG